MTRERSGTTLTGIVPTNTYQCRDGKYVIIGGNGDSIFRRLMYLVGRPDMAEDARLKTNAGRVQHDGEVDAVIEAWTLKLEAAEILQQLEAAAIPGGLINSVADMMLDPHFQSRGLFETIALEGQELVLPAILPKLTQTPGRTDWPGPCIGSHNDEILGQLLGLSEFDLKRLEERKIIAPPSSNVPVLPAKPA